MQLCPPVTIDGFPGISARDAYNNEGSLQSVAEGLRPVAYISNSTGGHLVEKLGLKIMPIHPDPQDPSTRQRVTNILKDFPDGDFDSCYEHFFNHVVAYKPGSEIWAERAVNILKAPENARTALETGRVLGYHDQDIQEYVDRVYGLGSFESLTGVTESFINLFEAFDTVSDFLLNPENRDKEFWDLEREFKEAGGEMLGAGAFGQVWSHPSWDHVVKTFQEDMYYLRFVRFCLKNPHPCFPKFLDKPRRIRPEYMRGQQAEFLYMVRIEKLFPLENPKEEWPLIWGAYDSCKRMRYYDKWCNSGEPWLQDQAERVKSGWNATPPKLKQIAEAMDLFLSDEDTIGAFDNKSDCVMVREDGTYVFVDPVWEGAPNPYQQHDAAMRAEVGYWDDDDDDAEPPRRLRGGERKPRVKKPKPPKPVVYEPEPWDDDGEDIPF